MVRVGSAAGNNNTEGETRVNLHEINTELQALETKCSQAIENFDLPSPEDTRGPRNVHQRLSFVGACLDNLLLQTPPSTTKSEAKVGKDPSQHIEQLEARIRASERTAESLSEMIVCLRAQNRSTKQEYEDKIEKLEIQLSNTVQEKRAAQRNSQTAITDDELLQSQVQELKELLRHTTCAQETLRTEVSRLSAALADSKAELEDKEKELEHATDLREQAVDQLSALTKEYHQYQLESDSKRQALDNKIKLQQSQLLKTQQELRVSQEHPDRRLSELPEDHIDLLLKENEIKDLKQEIDSLHEQLSHQVHQSRIQHKQNNKFQEKLQEQENRLNENRMKINQLLDEKSQLKEQLEEIQHSDRERKKILQDLRQNWRSAQQSLASEVEDAQQQIEEHKKKRLAAKSVTEKLACTLEANQRNMAIIYETVTQNCCKQTLAINTIHEQTHENIRRLDSSKAGASNRPARNEIPAKTKSHALPKEPEQVQKRITEYFSRLAQAVDGLNETNQELSAMLTSRHESISSHVFSYFTDCFKHESAALSSLSQETTNPRHPNLNSIPRSSSKVEQQAVDGSEIQ